VYDRRPRADAAADLPHLAALADQAAVAIANARLYESMEENLRQTRALQRVTAALAGSLDLHELLDLAINSAIQIFGASRAAIFLANPGEASISTVASQGLSEEYLDAVRRRYEPQTIEAAARMPDERFVADARTDPYMEPLRAEIEREAIRSMLFVSLRSREQR